MPVPKAIELLRVDGKHENPRARQASMSAPRGDSIATAICNGDAPAHSTIQSKHACTASAVWAIRRSSRWCPVASTTHTAWPALPHALGVTVS